MVEVDSKIYTQQTGLYLSLMYVILKYSTQLGGEQGGWLALALALHQGLGCRGITKGEWGSTASENHQKL